MKCFVCTKQLLSHKPLWEIPLGTSVLPFKIASRFFQISAHLMGRKNTVGFTHGDVEEERIKKGFGADGKYTQLPEPIRDYSQKAPDLKLNEPKKTFDPYSMRKKNLGANDFYDVLADPKFDMKRNVNAPYWVKRAARQNELQRALSKKKAIGSQMSTKEVRLMNKRVWFLFKKYNFKSSQDAPPYPE